MKAYIEKSNANRIPFLSLQQEDNGDTDTVYLVAVHPDTGKLIASLIMFEDNKTTRLFGAKTCIEDEGFSTDFASWTRDGAIMLQEEFS